MKAIGNTLHSVARSVQRKAQALHHALPERNLINEALQGITAQLRGQTTATIISGAMTASHCCGR